ncbi:hypothetical protein Poli38472_014082 [Pythium oligandrum]|uniref:E2F/DP family winged-helix DNA-binding domain-containing protein n=1 Tax=Pythium oligandrum TaxID=41045 RepID=A0A8K1CQB2_PYTOL|nr:hypothetical protein Poli38472_014082 [Pythium oligandrum]|eukprot:TMW66770.1 hypothetical protein Poli38472_014082 [Pythium oligandrum]
MDHRPPPSPHRFHTQASPLRASKDALAPTTPATGAVQWSERTLHQPSPNRTEAAAAMMHLFASSSTESTATAVPSNPLALRLPVHPPVPGVKVKRRYVRKVPRKPSTAVKKLVKISEAPTNEGNTTGTNGVAISIAPPSVPERTVDTEKLEPKQGNNTDDVRFFPFREYNRKEKSLGLLCENFLKLYRSDQVSEICLDRAAAQLGVERRRIYDIVNILESIHLVSRKSKNLYNWHGLSALPVSTAAMKQKYADAQNEGSGGYDYNFKDRRRGKSLSKLSQMFVQLFLKKDQCIIPLDQAAKQLIQMEESENEEDRLLKTKIRRLYDVANVLVSVGLIEKLQLSNSRKPVFRWKNRTGSESEAVATEASEVDGSMQVDDVSIAAVKDEAAKNSSPSSEESDNGADDSSSESASEKGDNKRKHVTCASPSGSSSSSDDDGERSKRIKGEEPSTITTTGTTTEASSSPSTRQFLRFDQNDMPIHPQLVLQEQQLSVRQFMQQYIREYVDYIILQQVRNSESTTTQATTQAVVSALAQDIQSTPISMPSLVNRVTSDLAGSLHDLLFASTSSTSPQSVAELFEARVAPKPSAITSSPSSEASSSGQEELETQTRRLFAAVAKPAAESA